MQETKLEALYRVNNYIDSFAPGHYARVLEAVDRKSGQSVAFKVLRPEHLTENAEPAWEFKAFGNEVFLLMKMSGSGHVVDLLDCGYIKARDERPVKGDCVSYQADMLGFIRDLNVYAERGWRPYLALEYLPRAHNLLYLMKPNTAGVRWRLPTEEGLALALQFAEVLKQAHQQRIVYLDHKLEHVYWDGQTLRIIDWNSSRMVEGSSSRTAQLFQTDIHDFIVGILYPVFTGLSPQKGTLAAQPAAPNAVDRRYANINTLDFGVEPTLSFGLRELLQRGAARGFGSVEEFVDELQTVAGRFGWSFPHRPASDALVQARARMRDSLSKLRAGQDAIREARNILLEAAITDGINDDTEQEIRRLLGAINDMLARRVIP
ncbi:MAG: hypothetical protein Kow0077_08020 [Anaerolineae bacterium]